MFFMVLFVVLIVILSSLMECKCNQASEESSQWLQIYTLWRFFASAQNDLCVCMKARAFPGTCYSSTREDQQPNGCWRFWFDLYWRRSHPGFAETEGIEPPRLLHPTVFKTASSTNRTISQTDCYNYRAYKQKKPHAFGVGLRTIYKNPRSQSSAIAYLFPVCRRGLP